MQELQSGIAVIFIFGNSLSALPGRRLSGSSNKKVIFQRIVTGIKFVRKELQFEHCVCKYGRQILISRFAIQTEAGTAGVRMTTPGAWR